VPDAHILPPVPHRLLMSFNLLAMVT
jgi:hypothetical protein